jgi:FAD:protein FMN transferase
MGYSFTTLALGTQWWIEIFDDIDTELHPTIHDDVVRFLYIYEQQYSRFISTSTVSILNRERSIDTSDSRFVDICITGQKLYRESNGLFNFLLGEILDARGYDATLSFVPTNHYTDKHFPNPLTDLDISNTTITLKSGYIDIGGFGKGYAIDALAGRLLSVHGLHSFLINGGGDMFGTHNHGEPITIYLEHPIEANHILGTVSLHQQGFAASSPHKRRWTHKKQTYHHIINHLNSDDKVTIADASFVLAPTATIADAWATISLMTATIPAHIPISLALYHQETQSCIYDPSFPFKAI